MADVTITGLPNATVPLTGTERVPMDQSGTTKDASTQDIAALATKQTVGLGNVDNTSDANKPVSTAQATAIAGAVAAHVAAADPHTQYVQPGDSPTFAGLTVTGTGPVAIPHIHGSIAGNFYVHVRNTSGETLAAGTAIYATGSVGDTDRITVAACDPTDTAKMPAIGILETTLANNGDGDAVILGELRPFNTAAFSLNQQLYIGAGGVLTGTVPGSGIVQAVGTVARVQSNTGAIVVHIGDRLGTAALRAVGSGAGTVAAGDDARFTDPRTPTAHKATHAIGGTDVLSPADIGAEVAGAAAAAQAAAISAAASDATTKANAAQAAAIAASAPAAQGVTGGNSHDHNGGDGAQIAYSSLSGLPTIGTAAGNLVQLDNAGRLPAVDASQLTNLPSGSVISVSGTAPIVSSGGNTPTISLADTAVTPGNYGSSNQVSGFTVDAKGRLTAASNITISIVSSAISDSTSAGRALLTGADAAAQRTSLGLGSLATQSGTFSGTSSGINTGDVTLGASVADVLDLSGQELRADDPGADRILFWDDSESKLRHLTIGANLTISGTTLDASGGSGVSDGDKGDITVSGGGATWTVDNDAISYAKFQNVSTTDRILGRSSSGAGDVEEIVCTAAGRSLLDDADAAAQRATLGAAASGAIGSSGLTMATQRILGRGTATTGAVEEIQLSGALSLSGTTLEFSDVVKLVISNKGETATAATNYVETTVQRACTVTGAFWELAPTATGSSSSQSMLFARRSGTKTSLLSSNASLAAGAVLTDATSLLTGTLTLSAGDTLGVDLVSIGTNSSGHIFTILLRYS